MASLSDILTSVQQGVNAFNGFVSELAKSSPSFTSGQVSADALIQTGFVRVLGVSVVDGGAVGALHDAAALADADADNQVYVVDTTEGFFKTNMVFKNGLVYKPGSGQIAAFFYART